MIRTAPPIISPRLPLLYEKEILIKYFKNQKTYDKINKLSENDSQRVA